MSRREECPKCLASLRACRGCDFYDTAASNDCREPMADLVAEKEAANLCDYFCPRMEAGRQPTPPTRTPKPGWKRCSGKLSRKGRAAWPRRRQRTRAATRKKRRPPGKNWSPCSAVRRNNPHYPDECRISWSSLTIPYIITAS